MEKIMNQTQVLDLIDQSDFFRIGDLTEGNEKIKLINFYGIYRQRRPNELEEKVIQEKMKVMEYMELVLPNNAQFTNFISYCSKKETLQIKEAPVLYKEEEDESHLFAYIELDGYIEITGEVDDEIRNRCIQLRNSHFLHTNLFWQLEFSDHGFAFPSSSIYLRKEHCAFHFLKQDMDKYRPYFPENKIHQYPYICEGNLDNQLRDILKKTYQNYPYIRLELYKNGICIYEQKLCNPDNTYECTKRNDRTFY